MFTCGKTSSLLSSGGVFISKDSWYTRPLTVLFDFELNWNFDLTQLIFFLSNLLSLFPTVALSLNTKQLHEHQLLVAWSN